MDIRQRLYNSLQALPVVSGLTHDFYRYPARFPAFFAREVILEFSQVGDCILDPFMGGGTAIVEALASGRSAVGVDINSLAHFITTVKTTPLNPSDLQAIMRWAQHLQTHYQVSAGFKMPVAQVYLRNLPYSAKCFFGYAVQSLQSLPYKRQQLFARCALLRLGQWAIDCKESIPSIRQMKKHLIQDVHEMAQGMDAFIRVCQERAGVRKNAIRWQRQLLHRSAVGIDRNQNIAWLRPKLVITSPPYPRIHVLYHRWQVKGRRETPAPYWIAALNDGQGASYYTFGDRSSLRLTRYFRTLTAAFRSIRALIAPDALVVQMVSFSHPEAELPAFLQAMEGAGYYECSPFVTPIPSRLWRSVPHRKWYTWLTDSQSNQTTRGRQEVLLFHRPR